MDLIDPQSRSIFHLVFETTPNYRDREKLFRPRHTGRVFPLYGVRFPPAARPSDLPSRKSMYLDGLGVTTVTGSFPWCCGIGRSGYVSAPSSRLVLLADWPRKRSQFLRVVRADRSVVSIIIFATHHPSSIRDRRRAVTRARASAPWTDARVHTRVLVCI